MTKNVFGGPVGKIIKLLNGKERRNLIFVFLAAFMTALIAVMGVGSIMPFLAVAANASIIHTNSYLSLVFHALGFTDDRSFLIFLGLAVLGFLVVTSALNALARYATVRFTSSCRHTMSMRLLATYLGQDYIFFLSRSSADLVKNITVEIKNMITDTLMNFVEGVSVSLQLTFYVVFLFAVSPLATLIMLIGIGGAYGGIYGGMRARIKRLGTERFQLNLERSQIVSEAFWGFKESKIFSAEKSHLDRYKTPSERLARNESLGEIVGDLPRFALEAIAFSGIILFVLWSIIETGSFQNAAATVGLFAFAGYRMIPAIQTLFKDLTKMRYGASTVEAMVPEFGLFHKGLLPLESPSAKMPFTQSVVLEDLYYAYPETNRFVLNGLSLTIPYHSTLGFVGSTGAGKSTLIDVLLGLLNFQRGRILVDGVPVVRENLKSWQANIGYVPQSIYLSNASVAENIAFAVPVEEIDMARVEQAAKLAQIHDFIVGQAARGYQTSIGERGIQLSGGQRQRIGIARALYRNPEVLILDEATSALDGVTEAAIMEAIHQLGHSMTIIIVAHRLTTLKACDNIFVLDSGMVVDQGTYSALMETNAQFREMAGQGKKA